MSFEEDPEVIADLQLRASSERDGSRTRGAGVYDWKKAGDVAWWPCRGCKSLVGVVEDVCAYRQQFNGYLRKRMEAEIPIDGVVLCAKCYARLAKERSHVMFDRKAEVADAIRKLKDHQNPRGIDGQHDAKGAQAILELLKKRHHPDINGLLDAIDARRASKGNVRQRASGL